MDIQPPKDGARTPKPPEEVLNSFIKDLDSLRQNVTSQLSQDVEALKNEKKQLKADVEQLRQQYQKMQSQQLESLSQKQISQNQLWLKQLAQVLANNLEEQLSKKLDLVRSNGETSGALPGGELPMANPSPLSQEPLRESLALSLQKTIAGLQEELNSYQSNLSQQLSNMRSMEKQGEIILETLVDRLRQELEDAAEYSSAWTDTERANEAAAEDAPAPPPAAVAQPTPATPKPASQVQLGLIFAVLSAIVLSLFNVSIKMILKGATPKMVFGAIPVEGVITAGFGNSLLILFLRMIVVCLLMPFLAAFLYPAVGNDIVRSIKSKDKDLWLKVIGSAFFLFLSQVCIYIALGNVATGIAITLFFIYPIATTLGAWFLFSDRPSIIRFLAMGGITAGLILAAKPSFGIAAFGNPVLGIIAAIAAGVTFAGYVLLTQMAAGKLHPIPFSLVNFCAIFVFSALSLILLPGLIGLGLPDSFSVSDIQPEARLGLIIGGAILGVLTLFSYLLNNFAIRYAGAALASVIGTLGPALTAFFAWIVIKETLLPIQLLGMVVVTLSVIAISLERIFAPKKKVS